MNLFRGKSPVEVTEKGHFSARIGESMAGQMLDYFPSLAYFFFCAWYFNSFWRKEQFLCSSLNYLNNLAGKIIVCS